MSIRPSLIVAIVSALALYKATTALYEKRRRTTALSGPPSPSTMFGMTKVLRQAENPVMLFEEWAKTYGNVYRLPSSALFAERIILCDPRALAHILDQDSLGYVSSNFTKQFAEKLFGRGLVWSDGEDHRRQRKSLSPAFSNGEIKVMTNVFYDCAYRLKEKWEELLDRNSSVETIIDISQWGSRVALDSMGIVGFGHDFQALEGKRSAVMDLFDSFATTGEGSPYTLLFFLAFAFPVLNNIPNPRNQLADSFGKTFKVIADDLLKKCRSQEAFGGEKSIMGMLIKSEGSALSTEEVIAQNVLILAGFETTSITLTWTIIELCRNEDKQQRLRDELAAFAGDLTFDQLISPSFAPYLDAVVHETLRLHPALPEIARVSTKDDVIPLSKPILTQDGNLVDSVFLEEGASILIPFEYINQATDIWGPTAKDYMPERWLNGGLQKDLPGYKHMLTFSDGPRTCLGKTFALTELKVLLFVMIRNFTFEFQDGLSTIGRIPSLLPRPKILGSEDGFVAPLIIRRAEV